MQTELRRGKGPGSGSLTHAREGVLERHVGPAQETLRRQQVDHAVLYMKNTSAIAVCQAADCIHG